MRGGCWTYGALACALLGAAPAVGTAGTLGAADAALAGASRAQVGDHFAAHVVRLDDGAELLARGADALLVPASNIKLVTAAAALRLLGPDYQFPTEVFGELLADGVVAGDLAVKGYGDPYVLPERLWALAGRLAFLGVRVITGDLVIDDSYFAGDRRAVGWEQDHTQSAYMAPAGAVSVAFNALQVHVLPAARAGMPARVLLDPPSDYAPIEGSVTTVEGGRSQVQVALRRAGGHEVVHVGGRIARGDARHYWRRVSDPPLFYGALLRDALERRGIGFHGALRLGIADPAVPKLIEQPSSRLAELLAPLNKHSNNFMAAQLALALGAHRGGPPGTWEKGRAAIAAFLTDEVGLAPGSFVLGNASGLHDVNRFSARQMTALLAYMYRQPALYPEFATSLAVAGGIGTLAERMRDTPAAHLLRAKTGTLARASALSGYVRAASGEPLAFSVLVNNYPRLDRAVAAQDGIGAALAAWHLPRAPEATPP